jgi:hypothetical protein
VIDVFELTNLPRDSIASRTYDMAYARLSDVMDELHRRVRRAGYTRTRQSCAGCTTFRRHARTSWSGLRTSPSCSCLHTNTRTRNDTGSRSGHWARVQRGCVSHSVSCCWPATASAGTRRWTPDPIEQVPSRTRCTKCPSRGVQCSPTDRVQRWTHSRHQTRSWNSCDGSAPWRDDDVKKMHTHSRVHSTA